MSLTKKKPIPWVAYGFRRPNFHLPPIRVRLPRTIPRQVISVGALLVVFYIFAGGVYNSVADNVQTFGFRNEKIQLVKWDRGEVDSQYKFEGLVAGILIYLGSFGLYLIREGSRDPHNPNRTNNYQIIGTLFVSFSFFLLERMMDIKTSSIPPA
ncbi:MAG: hypothetical protein ACW98K_10195 [Candidatus Kariarchaeaceae archaeon]|jgi:hypothetical protein